MSPLLPALAVLTSGAALAGCHLGFDLEYRPAEHARMTGPCSRPAVRHADVREDRGAISAFVELDLGAGAATEEPARLRVTGADLAAPPFGVQDVEVQVLDADALVGRTAVSLDSVVSVPERRLFVLGYLDWYGSEYRQPRKVERALRDGELAVRLAWEETGGYGPCEATVILKPSR